MIRNDRKRPTGRITFALAALALLGVALLPAEGANIYSTGFENPTTFVAGSPLVGQDGWIGVDSIAGPPFLPPCSVDCLSPNAAVISTDLPRQGRQTVRVWGGDLVHQDFINAATAGYYDAIGSYRHPVDYDTGGTQIVRVSANVRVDGRRTRTGNNFFSASVIAIGDDGEGIGELAISSDGHVYGHSGNGLVPTFLTRARVSLRQWHNLAIEVDFAAQTYSFFVDGRPLGTFPWDAGITSNILQRGSILAYAAPDTATLHKDNYTAHFDRFSIKVVPRDDDDDDDEDDGDDDDDDRDDDEERDN